MNTGNLIACPVTEDDKYRALEDLQADMAEVLEKSSRLKCTADRAEYVAALNVYNMAQLYIIAKEYVALYDLAPIEH